MRKSVIVLLSVCAMTSCGKEDVEPQGHTGGEREKVAVVDGVLHFATTGDYFDFSVEMANKDPEERRAWEERNGFTSMLTFAEDVMGDPELRYGEALARPEIFSVSSDSVIDIEVPITYATVANEVGYYYVGDAIVKVDAHYVAQANRGDKALVDELLRDRRSLDDTTAWVYCHTAECVLKSATGEKRIIRASDKLKANNLWMDYSISVHYESVSDTEGKIVVEQRSKNFKKKVRRWREHRNGNSYSNVYVTLYHPSLVQSYGSDHFTSGPLEYNGKESVNHYFVSLVNVYSYNGRQLNESRPYITELKGNVYCGGILESLQLDKVFQNQ